MNILALDVATKTGWATASASGTWDFTLKRDESSGMRIIRFKSKLKEIVKLEDIDMVCFERTAGHHQAAVIVQAELHGVLKLFCEENEIPYRAFSASEIKKFATGKGNASKKLMMVACKARLKKMPKDDNEADALWVYHLAKKECD